ncbi:ABC transporter ATP-binding protein [Inquilinus sp. Marseille-Q2685]|uniref:ABC transporter ATP-binding protein n=1 Tax=Inquilinus sp. Marseille-Q2685 TaxID=2866581 RepID=UPI001CE4AB2D|nr:ABC transporter ATP-binding protein [Inquilinus sp. Marseille-Q2685]
MTALSAEGLTIGYGGTAVVAGIDLALEAGTVTCLLGPNGVGKTTLFKTLLGLIPPLAGTVRVGGEALDRLRPATVARRVAYVPQAYPGDFAYTVLDLVVMGRTAALGAFAVPGKADLDIAMRALGALGIAALAPRDSTRISGGQRQLALIARALAQQAGVVVMDEPTASLDLGNRLMVLDRIRALAADGLAVLVSTHEPEHAFAVADRVAVLEPGGRFEAGPVESVLTPDRLTRLYGVTLTVERTATGRFVVSPVCPNRGSQARS